MARPARKAGQKTEGGLRVSVRVTPRGGRDAIVSASKDEAGQFRLLVKVAAPPADGAANTAVVAMVAKAFGVAKSYVRILRGETALERLICIEGDATAQEDRLAELERTPS